MIWDWVDHFLSLSVTLLQPFLTLATSQTNVPNVPLPESFCLCSSSCLELFSSQSYLYFIQVWAQISTPQRNLTEHPILLFCLPLHHVVLFHCHLLLLNLNLQPLLHFFHYLFWWLECRIHVSSGSFVHLCAPEPRTVPEHSRFSEICVNRQWWRWRQS